MKSLLERNLSITESTDIDVSSLTISDQTVSTSERISDTEIAFFLPSPGSLRHRITIGGSDTKELHHPRLRRSDPSGATQGDNSSPLSQQQCASEIFSPMSPQRVSEIFIRERCQILFNGNKSKDSGFVADMQALFDSNELTEVDGNDYLKELPATSTAVSPKTNSSSSTKKKRGSCPVAFGGVEIREYPSIPGDNPAVTKGPPLTIGWTPVSTVRIAHIDKYEEVRGRHRRSSNQLQMPTEQRMDILRNQGFDQADIHKSTKQASMARRQRKETVSTLKHQAALEKLESIQRKAYNFLTFGRRKKAQDEYLKKHVPFYGVTHSDGVVSDATTAVQ